MHRRASGTLSYFSKGIAIILVNTTLLQYKIRESCISPSSVESLMKKEEGRKEHAINGISLWKSSVWFEAVKLLRSKWVHSVRET